ncbi:Transposase, Ptta/En/Spm, plant [Corchorus olitorius]|uniref:Transposase, Ptta/En/Spm, plant n=1 Tax=Corchorus olitorius TaxID=93759 RepID=A0A1R3I703_9ROSI|nr:Transposase, Ptta/En/Spm, plant [Corchorus olitorius]
MDSDPPPPVRGRATPLHPLPFMPPATTGRINKSGTSDGSSSSSQQPPVPERLQVKPPKHRSLQQRHPPPVEQHQTDQPPSPVVQPQSDQPPPPVVQPQSDQPPPPAPERVQNQQLKRDIDEEEDHELGDDFEAEDGEQQSTGRGECHRIMFTIAEGYWNGPWPCWTMVPEWVQEEMFQDWTVFYTYPVEMEKEVRKVFRSRVGKHISKAFALAREVIGIPPLPWVPEPAWNILRAYWQSREFREQSDRNRRNRASEAGSSSYRGGSIDTRTHRRRLTVELNREPFDHELFTRTHGLRDKSFPPGRARITMDKFNAALKAAQAAAGEDPIARAAIDQNAMFAQYAVGGSKGRHLGKGYSSPVNPTPRVVYAAVKQCSCPEQHQPSTATISPAVF